MLRRLRKHQNTGLICVYHWWRYLLSDVLLYPLAYCNVRLKVYGCSTSLPSSVIGVNVQYSWKIIVYRAHWGLSVCENLRHTAKHVLKMTNHYHTLASHRNVEWQHQWFLVHWPWDCWQWCVSSFPLPTWLPTHTTMLTHIYLSISHCALQEAL